MICSSSLTLTLSTCHNMLLLEGGTPVPHLTHKQLRVDLIRLRMHVHICSGIRVCVKETAAGLAPTRLGHFFGHENFTILFR